MPQIRPINWLGLFFVFNLVLFILMSKINFILKLNNKIRLTELISIAPTKKFYI